MKSKRLSSTWSRLDADSHDSSHKCSLVSTAYMNIAINVSGFWRKRALYVNLLFTMLLYTFTNASVSKESLPKKNFDTATELKNEYFIDSISAGMASPCFRAASISLFVRPFPDISFICNIMHSDAMFLAITFLSGKEKIEKLLGLVSGNVLVKHPLNNDVAAPDGMSVSAWNECFNVRIRFSLACPWEPCLKKPAQCVVGFVAFIYLVGADALRIRFLTGSSSLSKPLSFVLLFLIDSLIEFVRVSFEFMMMLDSPRILVVHV